MKHAIIIAALQWEAALANNPVAKAIMNENAKLRSEVSMLTQEVIELRRINKELRAMLTGEVQGVNQ
jgi:hypothetical protein